MGPPISDHPQDFRRLEKWARGQERLATWEMAQVLGQGVRLETKAPQVAELQVLAAARYHEARLCVRVAEYQ